MTFFWIFENILVIIPPQKSGDSRAPLGLRRPRGAATSHSHSSTTTCRRKNGRRCPASARGERGNRPPGDGSLAPPPAFLRRCPLLFFSNSNSNYIRLNFRIAFWPLEPWTEPWARDDKRACANSKHNNTRTNHSSVQPSPLAVLVGGGWRTAARSLPEMAEYRQKMKLPPPYSPRLFPVSYKVLKNQPNNCSSRTRCTAVRTAALLYCCM